LQLKILPQLLVVGVVKVLEFNMINALMMQYEADIAKAKANIQIYLDNPAGIGEHPDLVAAVDSQVDLIAHAEDKIEVIKKYFSKG